MKITSIIWYDMLASVRFQRCVLRDATLDESVEHIRSGRCDRRYWTIWSVRLDCDLVRPDRSYPDSISYTIPAGQPVAVNTQDRLSPDSPDDGLLRLYPGGVSNASGEPLIVVDLNGGRYRDAGAIKAEMEAAGIDCPWPMAGLPVHGVA